MIAAIAASIANVPLPHIGLTKWLLPFHTDAEITALAADECPPSDVIVGGEVTSENQVTVIGPWIALGTALAVGISVLMIRRKSHPHI